MRLHVEYLEDRTLLSAAAVLPSLLPVTASGTNLTEASADVLSSLNSQIGGVLGPGQAEWFQLTVPDAVPVGLLSVRGEPVPGSSLAERVDLFNVDSPVIIDGLSVGGGGLLVTSTAQSTTSPFPAIDQILLPGIYYLEVSAAGSGTTTGAYALATAFTPLSADLLAQLIPDVNPGANVAISGAFSAIVQGDFRGNGITDLAVADRAAGTVTVLLGVGDGSFQAPVTYAVGGHPDALAAGDFFQDGRLDLAALDRTAGVVTVLPGLGDGTFAVARERALPSGDPAFADVFSPTPVLAVAGDFNRDGNLDEAALLPNDQGELQLSITLQIPVASNAFVETPFSPAPLPLEELLGGSPLYYPANGITSSPPHTPPLFADFNGDGIPDVVTVTQGGIILFRAGQETPQGMAFAAPVVVNANGAPLARAAAVIPGGSHARLAAIDLFSDTLSLYQVDPSTGQWQRTPGPATGLAPVALAAGDLDGDGIPDLVVANDLFGLASLSLYVGQPDGSFQPLTTLQTTDIKVGSSVSDLQLADLTGDGRLDIVLSNPDAGDLSVFLNARQTAGALQFLPEQRYRAGTGFYGVFLSVATLAGNEIFQSIDPTATFPNLYLVTSNEATRAVVSGDFTGNGFADLIAVNSGTNTITLLQAEQGASGAATGSYVDPQVVAMGNRPTAIVAGRFEGPSQPLDLAILNSGDNTVEVLRGNGAGSFAPLFTTSAGTDPTDLTVVDFNHDGIPDLAISNSFGDVLLLQGKGDGTFQPPVFTGDRTPLAVTVLQPNTSPAILLADQHTNQVSVQSLAPGSAQAVPVVVLADGSQTTLAPGAVYWAKLDANSPYFDAVVVASGANSILVYRGTGFTSTGQPTFAAAVPYPVGTDPVSVTIQDVNGDGIPDMLVADQGSNDIAELFGSHDVNGDWIGLHGPRFQSGGIGPIAVSVEQSGPAANPNLVVTDGTSGNFALLPGVGQGFFNDTDPAIFPVSASGLGSPSFLANGVGVAATGEGTLVAFDLNQLADSIHVVFTTASAEEVNALATAGTDVFAALQDGVVKDLRFDPAGQLAVAGTFDPLSGPASDPSALVVLESGQQVLVTSAGQEQIFIYAPALAFPSGAPGVPTGTAHETGVSLAPLLSSAPAVDVTLPEGETLTLVVTLIADVVPTSEAAATTAPPANLSGGGDDGDVAATVALAASPTSGLWLDPTERLRGLDLYQPPRDPGTDSPSSLRLPDPMLEQASALAALLPELVAPGEAPVTSATAVEVLPRGESQPLAPESALPLLAASNDTTLPRQEDPLAAYETAAGPSADLLFSEAVLPHQSSLECFSLMDVVVLSLAVSRPFHDPWARNRKRTSIGQVRPSQLP